MDDLISVNLKLETATCVRGESVFFEAVVANTAKAPLADFPDFDPTNEVLQLVAQGDKEQRTAHQGSYRERQGIYRHAEEQHTITLGIGEKLSLRDDLLAWFGELPPGKYEVTAVYAGRLMEVSSDPVALTVQPAAPLLADTPRIAAQSPSAPLTAAWTHKAGQGVQLFYEQRSPLLPRTPLHGAKVSEAKEVGGLWAATVLEPDSGGHLVWADERGQLLVGAVDASKPRPTAGVELKPPFKGRPLASPLSAAGGVLFLPFADEPRQRVAILRVETNGAFQATELDLQSAKPLGPYVCYWEYGRRLHFAWAAPRAREVFWGRLPLDDPKLGFTTRSAWVADDALLWLDAYLDLDTPARGAPYLEELRPPDQQGTAVATPAPAFMLWAVSETASGLKCTRVNAASGTPTAGPTLSTDGIKDPRVVSSAVTYTYELALLLADGKDQLYYGSTARGTVQPLSKVAGREITLKDCPGLLAAGGNARSPWVHLRYISERKSIEYVRVEPAEEADPVERAKPAARSRYTTS